MDDAAIIDLYWARSEQAIEATAARYGSYCSAIAFRILNDSGDAEECVNDTWLRAWNAMPPQRPGRLSAFLGRITRNLALDRWSARHAAKRGGQEAALALEELSYCIAARHSPEQQVDDAELAGAVNRFLHSLPVRPRNIFLARYWSFLPLKEIAGRYEMRENAVKVSLHRTRQNLRAFLKQEGLLE